MYRVCFLFASCFVVRAVSADDVHPCVRECSDGEDTRRCHYLFRLELFSTMSKACYHCPFNHTDCFRPHCIPADGVERALMSVNRQLPGPIIQVCEGDEVVVTVENHLGSESTSIHWHGLPQKGTPYMDGVPMVTQCPIPPYTSFRYHFRVETSGTHWWHGHSGFQKDDGVFGALVVKQPKSKDPHADLYDFDLSDHVVIIGDWLHRLGVAKFVAHHLVDDNNKPDTLLVNGKGRFRAFKDENTGETFHAPLAEFSVKEGQRYRFRMINNGIMNCPIEWSIDGHTMRVIASDGSPIEPIEVDSLVIYAGERFDFVLHTNQPVDKYWIKLRGLMDCDERFISAHQVAILKYEGSQREGDPNGHIDYFATARGGRQLNPLNVAPQEGSLMPIVIANAIMEDDQSLKPEADHKLFFPYDFNVIDNPHFHHQDYYPFEVALPQSRRFTPQINYVSLKFPPFPLLTQREQIKDGLFCNDSNIDQDHCEQHYCTCHYVIEVALGSTVEIILIDRGFKYDANHPFHLHGHSFRVVGMRRVAPNITLQEVQELERTGQIERKLSRAPLKDTVTVPDGGYTILRFVADNPGYWFFHCHISFHVETGMGVIFKVGSHQDMVPTPRNFPTCGDWGLDTHEDIKELSFSSEEVTTNAGKCFGGHLVLLIHIVTWNIATLMYI